MGSRVDEKGTGTHKRLKTYSRLWIMAQVRKTMPQMDEKAAVFQRELGIKAGLPSFSWRHIHHTKAGTRAPAMESSTIWVGSRTR